MDGSVCVSIRGLPVGRRNLTFTPLCPAGHLPHTGRDHCLADVPVPHEPFPAIAKVGLECGGGFLQISPRVGEMAGRPEGGNGTHRRLDVKK